jgi:hypothetical protein
VGQAIVYHFSRLRGNAIANMGTRKRILKAGG